MKLFLKNMVGDRCKLKVKAELEKLGVNYAAIELGQVEILERLSNEKRQLLDAGLKKSGLALLEDKKLILIERIRNIIIELIHYSDKPPKINFSEYLSEKLNYDYTYIANIFSEIQGITIEHYLIKHKIERIKELLIYDELNVTEIADKMHYSSVAHLSNQFKKYTGLTPSHYKHLKYKGRKTLDAL